jgi:hypothetical protein
MSLRYYPLSKVKPNKITKGLDFVLNGKPYTGKYYETFDGKFFTGANPIIGNNERLLKISEYKGAEYLNNTNMPTSLRNEFARKTNLTQIVEQQTFVAGVKIPPPKFKGEPTSYFPLPLQEDYNKGSFMRYFVKRVNSSGFVTEISQEEYSGIQNGIVPYDVSNYLTAKIMWKLTGPLNQKRISQYDIRAGIIDTNKRLVEKEEQTFLGLVSFIDGKYDKFSKPTE